MAAGYSFELFEVRLESYLNRKRELFKLAQIVPWTEKLLEMTIKTVINYCYLKDTDHKRVNVDTTVMEDEMLLSLESVI